MLITVRECKRKSNQFTMIFKIVFVLILFKYVNKHQNNAMMHEVH